MTRIFADSRIEVWVCRQLTTQGSPRDYRIDRYFTAAVTSQSFNYNRSRLENRIPQRSAVGCRRRGYRVLLNRTCTCPRAGRPRRAAPTGTIKANGLISCVCCRSR
jgi:hypothetical protein